MFTQLLTYPLGPVEWETPSLRSGLFPMGTIRPGMCGRLESEVPLRWLDLWNGRLRRCAQDCS